MTKLNLIYKKCHDLGLPIPYLFDLYCVGNDTFDAEDILLRQYLEKNGWITGSITYTDKSINLFKELDKFIKGKSPKKEIVVDSDKVKEFDEIFPTGKSGTGKYMRCNHTEITKSFLRFFKDHDYDWQTILEATRNYVLSEEAEEFKWTLRSKYFVTKLKEGTVVSELAEWCQRVRDGIEEEPKGNYGFEPKLL